MIEQAKSFLLLFLVALSLYFTYQLWYGQEPAELIAEDVYERVIVEDPRPPDQIIMPAKIVLDSGEGLNVFREGDPHYRHLWQFVSQQLMEQLDDFLVPDDLPDEEQEVLTSLNFYFNPLLPVGAEMPWLSEGPRVLVEKVELISYEYSTWLIEVSFTDDFKKIGLLPPEQTEQLAVSLSAIMNTEQPTYTVLTSETIEEFPELNLEIAGPVFLPDAPILLEDLAVKPEQINRERLLKTFFIDYNLARVIEERDGGLIYTDGEKGLRLTNTGFEFSYPRLEQGLAEISYREALLTSSSLISYHGGWPTDLRLSEVIFHDRGRLSYYSSEWKMHYRGFPLHVKKPTRILFNDLGLIHYSRSLVLIEGPVIENENENENDDEEHLPALNGWQELLEALPEILEDRFPGVRGKMNLEDLSLGYAVIKSGGELRARPVWAICISGELLLIEADSLSLLSEEEMF